MNEKVVDVDITFDVKINGVSVPDAVVTISGSTTIIIGDLEVVLPNVNVV